MKPIHIVRSALLAALALAAVVVAVVVAVGGHADHSVTEDYAGPVEKRALAERDPVVVDTGKGKALRFRLPEPARDATPGGVDPREE